jgi:ABC-2 type transport system ATP-binding protein
MIEISHLSKRFGALTAVDDLSLTLKPGEILGFLGANGAGKSTTMKMLTGFLIPDSGDIRVFGIDVTRNPRAVQAMIGYLPEGAPAYEDMRVLDFLRFIAEIRGFGGEERDRRVFDVVGKMSLGSVCAQTIETLSKGYKRRVGLAQAIIHDPRVLILDEPTDGLDPNQKHQVRSLIQGLSKDKIVIISTHILEEVTAVCSRAVIMAGGRLLEDCAPVELEQRSDTHRSVIVEFEGHVPLGAKEIMLSVAGVARVTSTETALTAFPEPDQSIYAEIYKALREMASVTSIYQERGRLDDVFRQITAGAES